MIGGVGRRIQKNVFSGWVDALGYPSHRYLDRVYSCHGGIFGDSKQTIVMPQTLRVVFLYDLDGENHLYMNRIKNRYGHDTREETYGKEYLDLITRPDEYDRWVMEPSTTYEIPNLVLDFTQTGTWEARSQGVWSFENVNKYRRADSEGKGWSWQHAYARKFFLNDTAGWSHTPLTSVPKNIKFSDFIQSELNNDAFESHPFLQRLERSTTGELRTWFFLCCASTPTAAPKVKVELHKLSAPKTHYVTDKDLPPEVDIDLTKDD